MRLANWNVRKIADEIGLTFEENANAYMDTIVEDAKSRCPVGTISRPDGWGTAHVVFIPRTGRNKGRLVDFKTIKRWYGREPGSLRDSIRRVNKEGSGNIRIYAGNFKVYWAHMVERGTSKTPAHPFLRPAFAAARSRLKTLIQNGK